MARIAVALSGGGHRAALFALGVLLYLADTRMNREVASISSVSGGSMTNAWVGQETDYAAVGPEEFEAAAGRLARQIARRGSAWAHWGSWLYLALLVALLAAAIWVWTWDMGWPGRLALSAGSVLVAVLLLELRSVVWGRAYAATLYRSGNGRPTRLSELNPGVEHVICATELHAGDHIYFSRRFVYSSGVGWGTPGDLPVHVAVQASTGFPGLFSVRWLRRRRFGFQHGAKRPPLLALLDGGLYDNMAEQWPLGMRDRLQRWGSKAPPLEPPEAVVVVNASAGIDWGRIGHLSIPVLGELFALNRTISILYDNTTAQRRRGMVARFDRAALEIRDGGAPEHPVGSLIYITQSPYRVPDLYADQTFWPDRADRARAAVQRLDALGLSRDEWRDRARASAGVRTTLRKLGTARSAALLHHAYVLAAMNLHVILGYPLVELPERSRFEKLLEDG